MQAEDRLKEGIPTTAFAFRGYNVTNLGRTPELLAHPTYGPRLSAVLGEASQTCSEALNRPVDLLTRVRSAKETTDLSSYAEDVALIVAVEIAQLRLLEEFFGIAVGDAKLVVGYSLGEAAALIAAGVYEMRHLLRVPITLADDAVALARDVALGVLFTRGPALDRTAVKRLCLEISHKGKGTLGISTYLSPNALLLLGQEDTLDRFRSAMRSVLPAQTHLRKNPHRWPPLHTPITWQRAIPNRAAVLLETLPGGFRSPSLPLLSGVTGRTSYNEHNSRELLHRWVDHPQRLWSMIYRTLAAGVETVVHVGPAPNLIPATFKRLGEDVRGQLAGRSPASLGLRAVACMVRRPWLAQLLPSCAALLRAPFIRHVNLEDWLLERTPT
jgi:[acyl-carrier-protein] S-malonyltransferase